MAAVSVLHAVEGGDHSLMVSKARLAAAGETQDQVEERALVAIRSFLEGALGGDRASPAWAPLMRNSRRQRRPRSSSPRGCGCAGGGAGDARGAGDGGSARGAAAGGTSGGRPGAGDAATPRGR